MHLHTADKNIVHWVLVLSPESHSIHRASPPFPVISFLSVNQFRLDNFLGTVGNAVHGPDPLHLRPLLHVLGHALGLHHLTDDALVAAAAFLIDVGKDGEEFARQNQVVQLERVGLLQIGQVHMPPLPNGADLLWQFDVGEVEVPDQPVLDAVLVNLLFQFFHVDTSISFFL